MTLNGKVAVVFAANGALSSHVAKAFAKEGAKVLVGGRNKDEIKRLADEIESNGGWVEAGKVDLMDERDIEKYLDLIVRHFEKIDIVFNGIGIRPSANDYGTATTEIDFQKFFEPVRVHLGSQFLTSRAAAKIMIKMKTQGTILTLSASLSRIKAPFMCGITSACTAIEGMTRVMAAEFGKHGIKVICMNPTAFPETRTIQETLTGIKMTSEVSPDKDQSGGSGLENYLLKRSPTLSEFGNMAAFLASDTGALLNGHVIDIDCGTHDVI